VQRKHFQIGGYMERVEKMSVFQWKTGHILETVRDRAEITINHEQEMAHDLPDEMKIIFL